MADDSSANSEYGPGKFRAIFEQGLDFAVDRLHSSTTLGVNAPSLSNACTGTKNADIRSSA